MYDLDGMFWGTVKAGYTWYCGSGWWQATCFIPGLGQARAVFKIGSAGLKMLNKGSKAAPKPAPKTAPKNNSPKQNKPKKTSVRPTNQVNQMIQRKQAPKSMVRADKGKVRGEKDHIHFKGGHALNVDGTWKHKGRKLTNEEKKFLKSIGWKY